MQILPAIDLRDGKCVRLEQGDYDRETIFAQDPAQMAMRWVGYGAQQLHLVDLDGARDGQLVNQEAIRAIVAAAGIPCQLGGGIRTEACIRELLALGLQRLVIGTQALKQPDWFREMARAFPDRLVLGIDARDGLVATEGWRETSTTPAHTLAAQFEDEPLAALVYTDIARDGMLQGANHSAMKQMKQATRFPVIASGGVTTLEDVRQLAQAGMDGCIIGRSLYEGSINLSEAIGVADQVSLKT